MRIWKGENLPETKINWTYLMEWQIVLGLIRLIISTVISWLGFRVTGEKNSGKGKEEIRMSISWAGTYIWLRDPIRKASDSRRTLFSKSPKVFPSRTLLVEYFVRVGCWVQNCMRRPFNSRDLLGCMALKVFMANAGLFSPPLTLVFIVEASGNLFHSLGASWGTKAVVENGENGPTCQPATCQSISPLQTTLEVGEET